MEVRSKLIKKLEFSPIAIFDLTKQELLIIEELITTNIIIKFIDNGSCLFPITTLHSDAYYIKLY
jgi:hypothetical protein